MPKGIGYKGGKGTQKPRPKPKGSSSPKPAKSGKKK